MHVYYYSKPAKKCFITNVPPFIPNKVLRPIIARKCVIVGELKPMPHSSIKYHIFSHSGERSVTVILDRSAKIVSDDVDTCYEGPNHHYIYQHNSCSSFVNDARNIELLSLNPGNINVLFKNF